MTKPKQAVITSSEAKGLAVEVLSPSRKLPIVAITTHFATGRPWVDPDALARELGEAASVVLIETGDATRELAASLPPKLDVFGGAVRMWIPGASEASKLSAHPLFFIYSEADARSVEGRIRRLILGNDPEGRLPPTTQELRAKVTSILGTRIELAAGELAGQLKFGDLTLSALADQMKVGQELRVRIHSSSTPDVIVFTNEGSLPSPWSRIRKGYRVGNVVRGKVVHIQKKFLLVDLLPDASGIVPLAEIDWAFVSDPAEFAKVGDIVAVQITALEPSEKRATLSMKRAKNTEPRPNASLYEGGRPFVWPTEAESPSQVAANQDGRVRELKQLLEQSRAELESSDAERDSLVARVRGLRSDLSAAKKEARSAHDRNDALDQRVRGQLDPTVSERAFLAAVRMEYAKSFDEADRHQYPLSRMRVGSDFLARLNALQGVSIDKVLEVCAQVAAGRAREIPSRKLDELQPADAGDTPVRQRQSDGATAYCCSLQDNSTSTRQLHWWAISGDDGQTIEFASVVGDTENGEPHQRV